MSIKLQAIMNEDLSYNELGKKAFLAEGLKVMKQLAKDLALPDGSFNIRTNKSGVACSGEVILHADNVYVSLEQRFGNSSEVLYRTCKGQKDYSGGHNNWASVSSFADGSLLAKVQRLISA